MSELKVKLSSNADKFLEQIVAKRHITKLVAIDQALALLAIADEAKDKGNMLGIVKEGTGAEIEPVGRILGVLEPSAA